MVDDELIVVSSSENKPVNWIVLGVVFSVMVLVDVTVLISEVIRFIRDKIRKSREEEIDTINIPLTDNN